MNRVTYVHQGCIYLIRNTVNTVQFSYISHILLKCFFFDGNAVFSTVSSVLVLGSIQDSWSPYKSLFRVTFDRFNASLMNNKY